MTRDCAAAWAAFSALRRATPRLAALLFLLTFWGTAAAETWTLSWIPATTYADGTPITGRTVTYTAYWSADPGNVAPMTPIAAGVAQPHAPFEPEAQGMVPGRTVYFRLRTELSSGEVSDYSPALAWVVPGTAPPPTPERPANLTIAGVSPAAATGPTLPGAPSATPVTWKLAWDPVARYAGGAMLPSGSTVRYDVYWTRDPSLAKASLVSLASSTAVPSAEFDPKAEGMEANERVYFAVVASLGTGAESALSEALAWRVSNKGPAPPSRGKITRKK